jgi:DNA-binding transcriptional LysR family regulator
MRVSTFTEAAELAARTDLATLLPSFTARDFLARRRLVRLLPDVTLPATPLHLVHPQRLRGAALLATLAVATSRALAEAEARVKS